MEEHLKQLVKDYENLVLKYIKRIQDAIRSHDLERAMKIDIKKHELQLVIEDLNNILNKSDV